MESGNLTLVKNVYLKGDNSGFTGAVTKNDNTIRFDAAKAGFSSASSVAITGTLWLWFNEGTITFGGDTTMTASGNCGINVPSTVSDITLVFGNNNGNVEMTKSGSNPYSVYVQNGNSWTQGSDKVTIKKTGAGTMTNLVANTYNFVAAGGTTYFATDSAAAITVEDGAAIGGNARVNSVTFEDGAAFEVFTTTADETTTVDNLTATTVTVEGALVVKMSEETAEEAGSGSNTTTVLTATTLNGDFAKQAVVNDAGAPVAVYGSGTDYWYAQKDGNTIQIYTRNPSNGFMILISSSESKEDVSDSALNSWLTGQGYALSTGAGCIAAETALNSENTHGMTGFEAYLLGYDNIEDAAPVMGATVSGENISLSFAGTTPRTIDGVTVTYAVQSTNSIESDWTEKASGTSSPVTLAFDNALLYNRLVATVGLSE